MSRAYSLGASMASFIAEIDSSSVDVAEYIAQRLLPLFELTERQSITGSELAAVLDLIGNDGRKLHRDACRGCGKPLLPHNSVAADGCPCNSPRGVNHGLVPKNTCTCVECDPAQTGSARGLS